MTTTIGPVDYDVRKGFVERVFGTLAQLEVVLPPDLSDVAWWVARLGFAAIVLALILKRNAVRRNAGVAVVLLTAGWTLVLSLHLVAYRSMLSTPGDPIISGRYLLPLIALFGIAVALVGSVLPALARAAYTGLVLAIVVALQVISLGLLLERFYA
jgi:hypothetical protein